MPKQPPIVNPEFAAGWLEEARQHPLYGHELAVLNLAEQFDAELERRGMTRAELARRAGVKASYISRVLNNPENITMQTLFRLANALELDVSLSLHSRAGKTPPRRPLRREPRPVRTTAQVR